ncbi:MAG: 4-(cytidine 5'-diphospho)-2-C-methyl-D-erythritol kinase [Oscillospiraceae bacterium]
MSISVKAYAKINLSLDIVGKRDDGYHLLRTVMQSIGLFDVIKVGICESGIKLVCDDPSVPTDERNTAYKACKLFFDATRQECGAVVEIQKNIPSQAGLGGASADAAAVLWALNTLSEIKLSKDALFEVGAKVGADVPFCMEGGTVLCEGIGEILTRLPPLPDCTILIAKPDAGVSTAAAYALFDSSTSPLKEYTDGVIKALKGKDIKDVCGALGNIFESLAGISEVESIKRECLKNGALGACMSGSGSAVYAVFDDEAKAEKCKSEISELCGFTHICKPVRA